MLQSQSAVAGGQGPGCDLGHGEVLGRAVAGGRDTHTDTHTDRHTHTHRQTRASTGRCFSHRAARRQSSLKLD
eukprot:3025627-Rhodomonas_salina.1